jgi:hypothetical protein
VSAAPPPQQGRPAALSSRFAAAWDAWWWAPVDTRLAALLRVAFGLVVLASFLLSLGSVELLWGEEGLVPYGMSRRLVARDLPTVFAFLPRTNAALWACFWVAVVQSVLLVLGVLPRVQAACLFVWVTSFQVRNIVITDGGDALLRLVLFFLIFLPLGARWALLPDPGPRTGPSWPLRFIQIEVTLVLLVAGLEKLPGNTWWDGSAMHYVFHLDDFSGNLWVPEWFRGSLLVSQLMSWSALLMEHVVPVTLWFERTRRLSLALVVGFHVVLLWTMNLYVFEWVMLAGWLAFVRWDDDVAWARGWLRRAPVKA